MPGTYEKYFEAKQVEGADPDSQAARMQPPGQVVDRLLAISAKLDGTVGE